MTSAANSVPNPSDEEVLSGWFTRRQKDRQLAPSFVAESAAMLLANGAIPQGIDPEQFVIEMFDPAKSFRGVKTDLLRQQVRPFLLPREEWLLKVPIGFLHTEDLNPFSVRAPSGGIAILMDNGIGLRMYQLGRSVLALTTWSAPEPYCHDHRPESWVNTILALAA